MTPDYEHTTGEDIVRQEVADDMQLEMAKADAADFFHTFRTVEDLQILKRFGLRPVSAEALARVAMQKAVDDPNLVDASSADVPGSTTFAPALVT